MGKPGANGEIHVKFPEKMALPTRNFRGFMWVCYRIATGSCGLQATRSPFTSHLLQEL